MGTKTKEVKVKKKVFTCDVCGREYEHHWDLTKCSLCGKDICPSALCGCFIEYTDEWCCKECKKVGEKHEAAIEAIQDEVEKKCFDIMEEWRIEVRGW